MHIHKDDIVLNLYSGRRITTHLKRDLCFCLNHQCDLDNPLSSSTMSMAAREKRGATFTWKEAIDMIHDDGKLKLYNNGPLTALYFIILITIIIISVNIFKKGH